LWFCCFKAASQGGETPIADCERVLAQLPRDIVDEFTRRGLVYIRNYGGGLGLDWPEVFRTRDTGEVESRCKDLGLHWRWEDGERLRTWSKRPAVMPHPISGRPLWFNQITHWHPSCLPPLVRSALTETVATEELPRNVVFGDGAAIPDEMVTAVCQAYEACEVSYPWREGDVLLLDNMRVCHARNRYSGTRKLAVALGE